MTRFVLIPALFCLLTAGPASAEVFESAFGDVLSCVEQDGVQFCEGSVGHRVESFDGLPIDLNLTLPPSDQTGPFPLIFSMHGWGGGKDNNPQTDFALDGYAVVSSSARGFHGSCGNLDARESDPTLSDPGICEREGWTHLADARFEARDIQHIAGLLADEGIAIPSKIGVTGASYGGGRSLVLAGLRNRVMLPDGTLAPWQSPGGLDMEIAAAAPLIPWSDLAASLQPNGSTLDGRVLNPYGTRAGVGKALWIAALFEGGQSNGYYAPLGVDPSADLFGWQNRIIAGEPYDDDVTAGIIQELTTFHSGYEIDNSIPPAPTFIYNAWTDDLFPADEAIRIWRRNTAAHPDAEYALYFDDNLGHPRAGFDADSSPIFDSIDQFFARHLKDTGGPLPGVTVLTQECGGSTKQGPFTADDWDTLRPGEVQFSSSTGGVFNEEAGAVARELIPLFGGPCRTVPAVDDPVSANWTFPAATGDGYTLMGSPRVVAHLSVEGKEYAQVASRLWDVSPDGTQSLITHDFYRPRPDGESVQVFELHPNGWHFADGHAPKLELLGQSDPTGQPSSGPFTVTVSQLELRLPVLDAPDGGAVAEPLAPTPVCASAPTDSCTDATGKARLKLGIKKSGDQQLKFSWKSDAQTTLEEFGIGALGSGFSVCLYDGAGAFQLALAVPRGMCGDKECWKASGKAFRFKDKKAERTGVKAAKFSANSRKTSIQVQAQGALGLPALPLTETPLTAQLVDGEGGCWGAPLTDVRKNEATKVDARTN